MWGECLHCALLCDLEALVGVCVCVEAHGGFSLTRWRCWRFATTDSLETNSLMTLPGQNDQCVFVGHQSEVKYLCGGLIKPLRSSRPTDTDLEC